LGYSHIVLQIVAGRIEREICAYFTMNQHSVDPKQLIMDPADHKVN